MIDPLNLGAIPIPSLPVTLEHERDIDEFDGPLLSEFRAENGERYLYHWCDCDTELNRWLVVRTPPQELFKYLAGQASLHSLVVENRDGFVYLVDLDANADVKRAWFVYSILLPLDYCPSVDSFRERDATTDPNYQDVYVGEKWGYERIAAYPRKYLQAYTFNTAFGQGGNPVDLHLRYNLTKGWIFHTAFNKIRSSAPREKRGSLDAVGLASPGFMRFRVDPTVAAGLRQTLTAFRHNRSRVGTLADGLRLWANGRSKGFPETSAREALHELCARLAIDGDAVVSHTNGLVVAVKLVLSYVSRLEFLDANDRTGRAVLLGVVPEETESGDGDEDEDDENGSSDWEDDDD